MYRTGDLARSLPDGNVEFCGRIDHQVKVHGFRVELGEIEQALREHGAVQDAVALVRDEPSGDRQLLAYVTAAPRQSALYAEELSVAALREYLKERLPRYMVPSAFVILPRLPLNANGKVDRQALAALAVRKEAEREAERDYVAPRTETERALASIWQELLSQEKVAIGDDVFDLGAHSLMAMKALTRMRDVFGVNLALRTLFERPTIAGLAEIIDGLASLQAVAASSQPHAGDREEIVL
jgi:aryl carrier-like protein